MHECIRTRPLRRVSVFSGIAMSDRQIRLPLVRQREGL